MRCLTSALICCSARSSWVMASTVELMDSTPRRIGGRTRFSPAWMTMSSIFQEAKPGAVILTRYFPGETAEKENAPVASDCVVRVVLSSVFSRVMWALEMVASSRVGDGAGEDGGAGCVGELDDGCRGCWARSFADEGPEKKSAEESGLPSRLDANWHTAHCCRLSEAESPRLRECGRAMEWL